MSASSSGSIGSILRDNRTWCPTAGGAGTGGSGERAASNEARKVLSTRQKLRRFVGLGPPLAVAHARKWQPQGLDEGE